jgi:hypothetical protein
MTVAMKSRYISGSTEQLSAHCDGLFSVGLGNFFPDWA